MRYSAAECSGAAQLAVVESLLHKLAGNEVLSGGKHELASVHLSKEHGCYRPHRVSALTETRYAAETNNFGIDTEVILQLLHAGARITKRAIPAYSAEERCRVYRPRVAAQVMTPNVLHRCALVHRDRFQPVAVSDQCEPKLGCAPGHSAAPRSVPDDARRQQRDSGLPIQVVKDIPAPIPKAIGNNRLSRGSLWLNQALIGISPGLFSDQLCAEATVLASTRASVEATTA
jgi:hypothetical protein